MKFKQIIILVIIAGVMAACTKDRASGNQPDIAVKAKDTIYLLNTMVTKQLLTPSPVTQTETFTYNSELQLTKHSVNYKSNTENYTTNYAIVYSNNKVVQVKKSGGNHYMWDKLAFTYSGKDIKVDYIYPDTESSITITLNSKGLAQKIQGNGQFYLFTYDAAGNITNRSQYENANPTKATVTIDYTYDKKHSPFSSQRDNNYILYLAFNDINTCVNNRISNNKLELYNITYNKAGYPEKMDVVHNPVAIRTVSYTYTTVIKTKK